MTDKETESVAIHESAHAVISCMQAVKSGPHSFKQACPFNYVTLRPRKAGVRAHVHTNGKVIRCQEAQMLMLIAGIAAEKKFHPDMTRDEMYCSMSDINEFYAIKDELGMTKEQEHHLFTVVNEQVDRAWSAIVEVAEELTKKGKLTQREVELIVWKHHIQHSIWV